MFCIVLTEVTLSYIISNHVVDEKTVNTLVTKGFPPQTL